MEVNFRNEISLKVGVQSVEHPTSKAGREYVRASAEFEAIPFEILAFEPEKVAGLTPGQHVVTGRLAYEESPEGEPKYLIYADGAPEKGRVNSLVVTLHAGPTEARYSPEGMMWTRMRAFLSMGKNKDGSYKPALWLTVKGFAAPSSESEDGYDEELPVFLSNLKSGELFTVWGRLQPGQSGELELIARYAHPARRDEQPEEISPEAEA